MTAHADDYTATFYNPAGLVTPPVMDLAAGLQYAKVKTEASNPAPVPAGWVRESEPFPIDPSGTDRPDMAGSDRSGQLCPNFLDFGPNRTRFPPFM